MAKNREMPLDATRFVQMLNVTTQQMMEYPKACQNDKNANHVFCVLKKMNEQLWNWMHTMLWWNLFQRKLSECCTPPLLFFWPTMKKRKRTSLSMVEASSPKKKRKTQKHVSDSEDNTASEDDELFAEVEEDMQEVSLKVKQLADLIKSSKNVCIFTGAGISQSAGLQTYRGKNGIWTNSNVNKAKDYDWQEKLWPHPTTTHMAIKSLIDAHLAHSVLTQNLDDLHLRSGLDPQKLVELHGNSFTEMCSNCSKIYCRDYLVAQV